MTFPAARAGSTARVLLDDMHALYRALHRNPELSGDERDTAAAIADQWRGAGLFVQQHLGGHGVAGVLANGPGPVVLLRAELDALPVDERSGVAYPSERPGVMHACGHDLHLAALTGAVRLLRDQRAHWRGTVVALAQPAEETLTGACALLADGLYERVPRPDVLLAQHVAPLPVGVIAHGDGAITLASVQLRITVGTSGGHAGLSGCAGDAIEAVYAVRAAVTDIAAAWGIGVTTCSIQAGASCNVVPASATLLAGLRGADEGALLAAATDLRTVLATVLRPDVDVRVEILGHTPSVGDDVGARTTVEQAHRDRFGAERVWPGFRSFAADDVALLARPDSGPPIPLVYWMLGCVGANAWRAAPGVTALERMAALPANHSPQFAPDPLPTLQIAILALATAARAHLVPPVPTAPVERIDHETRNLAAAGLQAGEAHRTRLLP